MSSPRRLLLRSLLLLGLSLAPGAARADALDLVRSIAAEPPPARQAAAGKRPTRPSRVAQPRDARRRPARVMPPARSLRLTAAQRGSGRVQVLDAGHASSRASNNAGALPTVERKSAAGLGPGLLAARAR